MSLSVSPRNSQEDVIPFVPSNEAPVSVQKEASAEAPVSVKKDLFTAEQKETIRTIFSYVPVVGTFIGISNAIEASKAEESPSLLETIKIIVQISSFLIVPQLLLGAGLAVAAAVNSFNEFMASRNENEDEDLPVDMSFFNNNAGTENIDPSVQFQAQ